MSLYVVNKYEYITPELYDDRFPKSALILCIILIIFIGMRPISGIYFGDTINYAGYYKKFWGLSFSFSWDVSNYIYDNWLSFCASKKIPISIFFTSITLVYFGAMFLACRKLFPESTMLAFLVCLAAFSTYSYSNNGIKAGAAASLFLLALAYKDKKWLCWPCILLSLGFHHSMSLVIIVFIIAIWFKDTKIYFIIWILCVFIAAAQITYFQNLFASYADETGAKYLLANAKDKDSYITGFRLDFILYSSVPILIGYWMIFKKAVFDENYELWLRIYLLTNSVWMLCMYANFTNRIAYLSWFIYPIVLIYPFIGFYWSENQIRWTKYAVLLHLSFTILMWTLGRI